MAKTTSAAGEQDKSVANVSAEALAEAFGKILEKVTASQQTNEGLAEAIANAIETSRGIREVTIGERGARGAFNPTGKKRELKGTFYINNLELRERTLSDEEIDLLHRITPGRYINKLVTVVQTKHPDGPITHISYSDKTMAQRLELKGLVPTFTSMLQRIVKEGEERDALIGDAKVVEAVNILMEQRQLSK